MAKYEPLQRHLATRPEQTARLAMTFDEVEALVGTLPPSARAHRAWWANDSKVQAQAWRAAGWRVHSVDQQAGRVVFTRSTGAGTYPIARKPRLRPPVPAPSRARFDIDDGMPEAQAQAGLPGTTLFRPSPRRRDQADGPGDTSAALVRAGDPQGDADVQRTPWLRNRHRPTGRADLSLPSPANSRKPAPARCHGLLHRPR